MAGGLRISRVFWGVGPSTPGYPPIPYPTLGRLRWTPLPAEDGPQNMTVRLVDCYGGSATQSFTITVVGENLPPLITSEPPTQARRTATR